MLFLRTVTGLLSPTARRLSTSRGRLDTSRVHPCRAKLVDKGLSIDSGEAISSLAELSYDQEMALLERRAEAYSSLPLVSTLVLGFSCQQLSRFTPEQAVQVPLVVDSCVVIFTVSILLSLYATVVFVLEYYYIKRLCGTAAPNLEGFSSRLEVTNRTYKLRRSARNAMWASLVALVVATGLACAITLVGPLPWVVFGGMCLGSCAVPYTVIQFNKLYLPVVSPARYSVTSTSKSSSDDASITSSDECIILDDINGEVLCGADAASDIWDE